MGKIILVVEDEEALRMTISANLELEGFEVVEAASGPEAIARIDERRFDIVLTDIRMPGMDGVELFDEIRRRQPDVPVVLMTAFALQERVDQAVGNGAFMVLPKPFEMDHLVTALATALRHPAVLVVDDTAAWAESTAAALAASGVRVRVALDGASAIDAIEKSEIDVCVVDMVMPGLSGPEVIDEIARVDQRVVFIAVSGHDAQELFRRAAARVDRFMRKPIDPSELTKVIARARQGAVTR
jgi:DNA-binding NtrC family response regulator